MDFKALIEKDRDSRKKDDFEGTFLDYLQIVKEDPMIAQLAHTRMYNILTKPGMEILKPEENLRIRKIYGNETIKSYNFFRNDFFGIEKTLMKLVNYFYSAAILGEESRQVLYLVGPVGSGK